MVLLVLYVREEYAPGLLPFVQAVKESLFAAILISCGFYRKLSVTLSATAATACLSRWEAPRSYGYAYINRAVKRIAFKYIHI